MTGNMKEPKLLGMAFIAGKLGVPVWKITRLFKKAKIVENIGGVGSGAFYVTTKARIRDCFPDIANLI